MTALLKRNQLLALKDRIHVLLYVLESYEGTCFTFQVVKQSSKCNKLSTTLRARIRAMIHLLLMRWGIEMRIQSVISVEGLVA